MASEVVMNADNTDGSWRMRVEGMHEATGGKRVDFFFTHPTVRKIDSCRTDDAFKAPASAAHC